MAFNFNVIIDMINIVNDSRILQAGDIFVLEKHAINFLPQIIAKKPSKIMVWHQIANHVKTDIETVIYYDKSEIILLLKQYYKLPKNIWAITGTNGKTSTASFISQMWSLFSIENINIGTNGIITSNNCNIGVEIDNTTPSVFNFYRILSQAKNHNINHVVFEASSHGLHQGRIDGIEVDIAGITNITQDHLDYHENMQEYFDAKMLLFDKYLNGIAIVNADIIEFEQIKTHCKNIVDYGYNAKCVRIVDSKFINGEFDTKLLINGKNYNVLLPVSAMFQVYNLCGVIAFFIAGGFNVEQIIANIIKLKSPIGRMQEVEKSIFVDYAHTPDALQKALESIKHDKKIVVVFGCGGDRDKTKRLIMGNIAAKLADIVIVTDDNPRTENAETIRKEIIGDNVNFVEISDRSEAIKYAIKNYYPDYCILIAGKGHEDYQIIGTEKHYFSDQDQVKRLFL